MGGSFSADLGKFAEKYDIRVKTVVRKFAFEAFRSVILKTPVATGRTRANWSVAIDQPNTSTTSDELDKSGIKTLSKVTKGLKEFTGEGSVFLTNNLPHVPTLEYGGYPNPPKSDGGKTSNGYSRQAPSGMVRITCEEITQFVEKALNE